MRRSAFVAILLAALAAMGCLVLGRLAADAHAVATISINSTADTDGDTIPDESDDCPLDPEIIDGELDGDGCPDTDALVVDVLPHSQIDLVVDVSLGQTVTATYQNGNEIADLRVTLLDYIQLPECTGDWTPEAGDAFMDDDVDTNGDTINDRHLSIIERTYTNVAADATIELIRERTVVCSAYTYPPPCADDVVDATVDVLNPVKDPNPSNNVLRIDHDLCAAGDSDGDTINDEIDNCPGQSNPGQEDADGDDVGDICDSCPDDAGNDADEDGICAGSGYKPPKTGDEDNCPDDPNPGQEDVGDGDGVGDACDNCPADPNPGQENSDTDGHGNACDNCPTVDNEDQLNSDSDSHGNACDNCPTVTNESQADGDGDDIGDVCDKCPDDTDNDGDSDGICTGPTYQAPATGADDNCPINYNPGQEDTDGDGAGDECDGDDDDDGVIDLQEEIPACWVDVDCDNDGICDGPIARPETAPGAPPGGCLAGPDNCPIDPNPGQEDTDGDGMGDICDIDTDNDGLADVDDPCAMDPDCDDDSKGLGEPLFFNDRVELFMGTDPLDECPDDPADDAWPPDFNNNGQTDIGDLVLLKNHWVPLGNPYDVRYDLNANDGCDIGDLVILQQYWIGSGYDTCTVG